MPAGIPTKSAATINPIPFAILCVQIESASIQCRPIGMDAAVMRDITLIGVIAGEFPNEVPHPARSHPDADRFDAASKSLVPRLMSTFHVCAAVTAVSTLGASEHGGTGNPFITRRHTLTVSTMTTHRIRVSTTASAASRR